MVMVMVMVMVIAIIMVNHQVLVFNNTGVGHKDTTSSFAPFNTLLGHEVCLTLSLVKLQPNTISLSTKTDL